MKLAITGATGTLGSALLRRLSTASVVSRLVAVSRDEVKQGNIAKELAACDTLRFFLADVRDEQRLREVFTGCDAVIHAAALKRVDRTAQDPEEVLKTNVLGTVNVLRAALDCGVKKVLVVSSDKAVMPTNFYGTTKALAEQLTVAWNAYGWPKGMASACVRYGNVLGSRGSVLEIWGDALLHKKPITLTHEEMTRFVITIEQAVDFVLSSLDRMRGGEIFIPKLSALRMIDVVKFFANASGRSGTYLVGGLRPGGEKLHERLLSDEEPSRTLWQEDRYIVTPWYRSWTAEPYAGTPIEPTFPYTSQMPVGGFLTCEKLRELVEPWLHEGAS